MQAGPSDIDAVWIYTLTYGGGIVSVIFYLFSNSTFFFFFSNLFYLYVFRVIAFPLI